MRWKFYSSRKQSLYLFVHIKVNVFFFLNDGQTHSESRNTCVLHEVKSLWMR